MADFVTKIRKTPLITSLLCASSIAITLAVTLHVVSDDKVLYVQELVFQKWEVWRLYTSLIFGSTGIKYILNLLTLYRSSSTLESGPYARKSADYAWQLLVASFAIIALNTPLAASSHSRSLVLCLTSLSSVLTPPDSQTSLLGLVTLPSRYLPFVMVGMDLAFGGPGAAVKSAAGVVVGYLWWWGVHGTGGSGGVLATFGSAPKWIKSIVGEAGAGSGAVAPAPEKVTKSDKAE